MAYILTHTRRVMDLCDPKPEDIQIEDIAHALAFLARANGHFPHFYSVGQHSINCGREAKSRGLSSRMQLACLLHDTSECYLSDLSRPVKQHVPEYLALETQQDVRPDGEARHYLSGRGSCLFNTPCRQAVYVDDYREASDINRMILGKGLSKQSFSISNRIREIDLLLERQPILKGKLLGPGGGVA